MSAASYLAATGEPASLRRWLSSLVPPRDSRQRLNRICDADDLVVFASPETPVVPLEEDRGVLIGRLYRGGEAPQRVTALSLSDSRHAAWSKGRSLVERLWGQYVAFIRDGDTVSTLRDPSGAVPCYFCEGGGIRLYVSSPQLLEGLGLESAELDEEFLWQWLTFPFLRTARTGLVGRSELLPGTLRTTGPRGVAVETAWTPWNAAGRHRRIEDFGEAVRRVREVGLGTVAAQLAQLERPVLELSGGLDSSIVAACLSGGGLDFTACNFATILPDGDERSYARQVAEALGVELAELVEDERPLDLSVPPAHALRPPLSPVLQPLRRALAGHARERGICDFVTGAGGDNLFCYLTTAAPILDAVADTGASAAFATFQDVAALGECSLWKAGRLALRKRLRQSARPRWKADVRFLSPEAVATMPDPHPWLDRPPGAAAGKIEHVESLVRVQHFLEPVYPSGERVHHPLLNQPLTELCLAIPAWLWVRGGRNRAVARAAFADLLPPDVIRRRTKGRLESMCSRAYSANRGAIREILLDGELARRRIVLTAELEEYLGGSGRPLDEAFYRLFDLVSLELWLRSWRS